MVSILIGVATILGIGSFEYRNAMFAGAFLTKTIVIEANQDLSPTQLGFDNYLATLSDEIRWKYYLYTRVIEEDLVYKDFLRLRKIGYCESRWQQYDTDGSVLAGRVHPPDKGIFQINESVWGERIVEVGYDIESSEGNIDFAIWLYKQYGSKPWYPSKSCWRTV